MKKITTFFVTISILVTLNILSFGQNSPIDFESGGFGASWSWDVFENVDNPPLEFISNPDMSGANTSATVAQFTAKTGGQPYAGTVTKDITPFTLDATNSTVKIMVWKSVISDVGIKFEAAAASTGEIKVANTLTNQWEELTFDFSGKIGEPSSANIDGLVIFPDFNARTTDNVIYFDNITFSAQSEIPTEPTVAAPVPARDATNDNVFSIFSDSYTNLENTNFNPNWGQATVTTTVDIEGNTTLKYEGLNYQGTNLGSDEGTDQDLTGYTHLHVDFWTANSTLLNFFLISRGSGEHPYSLPITAGEWVSVDIPLSHYSDLGLSLNDIFQFKVDGNGDIYFDNWYFYTGQVVATEPTEAAPVPTRDETADNVFSIFSDSYTNLEGTNINPNWGQATVTTTVDIEGNTTLKYEGLNYQGTNLGSDEGTDQDLTGYTHLHVDFWTANSTLLNFFLISRGSGEHPYSLPITAGEWVSVDIPLSHYSDLGLSLNDIFQFKVDGNGDIYFDNWYFYTGQVVATEPTEAAPVPTRDETADNVFSIFSDSYTNLEGTNINPNWGQATVTTTVDIEGNTTLKYEGLNYQGTNLGSDEGTDQDLTGYTHLHVDFWTANSTLLNFFLISRGSGEHPYSLPITAGEWVSVDIPLSHYSDLGLSLNDIFQFKVDGNGDIYFDNWYFYSVLTSVEEDITSLPSSYTLDQNYPNPFNPTTNIRFSLVESNNVTLKVMNVLGEEVATLVNEFRNAGTYEVSFDASSLPTGLYLYEINSGNFKSVKKMLLIK